MTVASISRSIREIETATRGTIIGRMLEMTRDQLAAYEKWRAESATWHAANPNAYEAMINGECEPPAPPTAISQPAPILQIGDDAADIWKCMMGNEL